MNVTEAGEEHADAVASFFWDAWRMSGPDAPGWVGASESVITELTRPEAIRARVGGPDRRMFLAWGEDRVVAFAATRRQDEETAELAGIVVRQDLVGHGIGTLLLEAVVQSMAEEGFLRMVVKTEAANERAIAFYCSRGFTPGAQVVEEVEGLPIELRELSRSL